MTQQLIGLGAVPDDGTGDNLRAAGDKINDNFTELYGDRAQPMTAMEVLADDDFVHIHVEAGMAKIRKADASEDTRPCDGYVPVAIDDDAVGTMVLPGTVIDTLAGLTPGSTYYLSTAAGGITDVAPSGAGELVQIIGKALSATKLLFNPQAGITL